MTEPTTYGQLVEILNEYFRDLYVRLEAIKEYSLQITLENTLQYEEIRLLKLELEGKFNLDNSTE